MNKHSFLTGLHFFLVFTAAAQHWEPMGTLPVEKGEHASFPEEGKIKIIGGIQNPKGGSPSILSYSVSTNSWTHESTWDNYRHHITTNASVYGHEVWVCGGKPPSGDNNGLNDVWVYNKDTHTWREGPSLPENHWGGPAVIVGNHLHVISGAKGARQVTDHHFVLDLTNEAAGWVSAPPILKPVVHCAGVNFKDEIWIIGGEIAHTHIGDRAWVQIYNPVTHTWREGPDLPMARSHLEWSTFAYNNKIYSFNGVDSSKPNGTRAQDEIFVYDPASNEWSLWGRTPHVSVSLSAIVIDGFVYLTGGGKSDWFDGTMKEVWRTSINTQ